jgi:hypothetical protein
MVYAPDNSKIYHETFVDNSIEYHENLAKELREKLDTLLNFKKELIEAYKKAPKKQKPAFEKKIKATDKQIEGTSAQENQATEIGGIWEDYEKNIINGTNEDIEVLIGEEKWKSSIGSLIGTSIEIEHFKLDSASYRLALKIKKSLTSQGYPSAKIRIQSSNSAEFAFANDRNAYKFIIEYCSNEKKKYDKLRSLLTQNFKNNVTGQDTGDCTNTYNPMKIKIQ